MARKAKLGRTYSAWFKAWRKAGAPKWPEVIKVVAVHWTDAAFSEEDTGTIDAIKVGLLKGATEKEIALAMEAFEDRDTRTHITVPAGMVNRVIDIATIQAFDREA